MCFRTRPRQDCRLCNGRGYLLVPPLNGVDSPEQEPCPKCFPYKPEPTAWWIWSLLGGLALGLLTVLLACLVLP